MGQYMITGMSCAACQARVEKAVSAVPGVTSCTVSLLTNSMNVEGTAGHKDVISAVEKAGYGASVCGNSDSRNNQSAKTMELLRDTETPKLKRRLISSVIFLILLMYITMGHNMWLWPLPSYFEHNHLALTLTQLLLAAAVMIINQKFFINGYRALFSGSPNMDSLVALGSSVSFGWSVFVFFKMCGMITEGMSNMELMDLYHNELYFESAAMIPALITVGKLLESISKGRTTNALKSLVALAPKKAFVIRNGIEIEIDADEVEKGDIFVVRPGESIPVDGEVLEGESAVNEAALTGESIPVDKFPGSKVSAATINESGFLKCRASRVGDDTTLSQIIRLVSDAAATKAPIARIADRISAVFVPAVISLAVIVIAGWLLAGEDLSFALSRGICVLVIACPCALGLATPVAVMVGNGLGAKNGILIKTGEALETIGRIDSVVLDKTGTITQGTPHVTDVVPAEGVTEAELLLYACSLEMKSEHPLAKAIVEEAAGRGLKAEKTQSFKIFPGNGLTAIIGGKTIHGGNRNYVESIITNGGSMFHQGEGFATEGKTPVYFSADNCILGLICVADVVKENSAEAIRQLKKLGLRTVMLTGDNECTAKAIGRITGVDEVVAGIMPDGKETVIRSIQKASKTAMVGDGINDAPALTRADVGIAIGAGTDVAIESADIVLVNSDLSDVAAGIRLGRGTIRNIHENFFWAFFYNLICIPLAAGLLPWKMNPMIAAAAMSLSSVTVCLNALRLNLLNIRDGRRDRPLRHHVRRTGQTEIKTMTRGTVILRIEGMMCPHCEMTVQKALEQFDFIEAASANHEKGVAEITLTGDFDEDAVRNVLQEKGYIYREIAI